MGPNFNRWPKRAYREAKRHNTNMEYSLLSKKIVSAQV
jgi:hypothetical protein